MFTVGEVECGGTKGVKVGTEEGIKSKAVEVKDDGRPKLIVGEGTESVCGNNA